MRKAEPGKGRKWSTKAYEDGSTVSRSGGTRKSMGGMDDGLKYNKMKRMKARMKPLKRPKPASTAGPVRMKRA
jgi:hypothetical protein